jgi:hypothetical protein
MGNREIRRVPPDWIHPTITDYAAQGRFGTTVRIQHVALSGNDMRQYYDASEMPDDKDFMPKWTEEEATHWQMYETCSEGMPISPVFEDPHALADWLHKNNVSVMADETIQAEAWLQIILGGDTMTLYNSAEHHKGIHTVIIPAQEGDQ